MALDATKLEGLIETELENAGFDFTDGRADEMAKAVAKAVVKHITTDSDVSGTTSDGATYSTTVQ